MLKWPLAYFLRWDDCTQKGFGFLAIRSNLNISKVKRKPSSLRHVGVDYICGVDGSAWVWICVFTLGLWILDMVILVVFLWREVQNIGLLFSIRSAMKLCICTAWCTVLVGASCRTGRLRMTWAWMKWIEENLCAFLQVDMKDFSGADMLYQSKASLWYLQLHLSHSQLSKGKYRRCSLFILCL